MCKTSFIRHRVKLTTIMIGVVVSSSCTWVKETSDGSAVALASEDAVGNCKKIGNTVSSVKDSVGFVNRNKKKVERELTTLAKNEAAVMGGNRIVRESPIEDGSQRFKVYYCE